MVRDYSRVTELVGRAETQVRERLGIIQGHKKTLDDAVRKANDALWNGNTGDIRNTLDEVATIFEGVMSLYQRQVTLPIIEERRAVTGEGYKKALLDYISIHTEDKLPKKEVLAYMKTRVPEDRRVNAALIAQKMKELGYFNAKTFYIRKQITTKSKGKK